MAGSMAAVAGARAAGPPAAAGASRCAQPTARAQHPQQASCTCCLHACAADSVSVSRQGRGPRGGPECELRGDAGLRTAWVLAPPRRCTLRGSSALTLPRTIGEHPPVAGAGHPHGHSRPVAGSSLWGLGGRPRARHRPQQRREHHRHGAGAATRSSVGAMGAASAVGGRTARLQPTTTQCSHSEATMCDPAVGEAAPYGHCPSQAISSPGGIPHLERTVLSDKAPHPPSTTPFCPMRLLARGSGVPT